MDFRHVSDGELSESHDRERHSHIAVSGPQFAALHFQNMRDASIKFDRRESFFVRSPASILQEQPAQGELGFRGRQALRPLHLRANVKGAVQHALGFLILAFPAQQGPHIQQAARQLRFVLGMRLAHGIRLAHERLGLLEQPQVAINLAKRIEHRRPGVGLILERPLRLPGRGPAGREA